MWSRVLPEPRAVVPAATITSAELVVTVALLGGALLAWAGLTLAHLGRYSVARSAPCPRSPGSAGVGRR